MTDESTQITLMVTDVLESLNIRYFIGGSVASTIHGVARTTLDSDLVAEIQLPHVPLLVQRLRDEFYLSMEAIFDAIEQRSSFNLVHLESMFKVDIFIAKDRPFEQAQLENRQAYLITTDPERSAYVASAEDTILAKLEWYRLGGEISDRQWQDVIGILRVQGDRLDVSYLREVATELKVLDLLMRAIDDGSPA